MRYLLDKNIIQHALTGLLLTPVRPLTQMQLGALDFLRFAEQTRDELFIPQPSVGILLRLQRYPEVRWLLSSTQVLSPGKYTKRWVRRTRETTGLTREDSMILSLGVFGTNQTGTILGVHGVVTYDQPMINGYANFSSNLANRLRAMTIQLQSPFRYAVLPFVGTPIDVIRWQRLAED